MTSVDDDERRNRPADAQPLAAPRDRIEQIGERHPGHERQQDVAEQPQHRDEHRERRDPEDDLPLESHQQRTTPPDPGASASIAGFRRIHVAHPLGEIEADRKQGQYRDQRHHQCQHRLGVEIVAVRGQHQAGEHDLHRRC